MLNISRRDTLLRDGLTFFVLSMMVLVLYGMTLFLFRSFESHRAELAVRWSERGERALRTGKPQQAITAMRAALSYAPDNRAYQLRLAEALADAGKAEEATSYYLNLRELRPGDGFINLQLARLARKKGEGTQAVEYYRASIFGDWRGTGLVSRRTVRLELADYLLQRHDLPGARAELLTGAGNAPDDPKLDLLFGEKLEKAGDVQDAAKYYEKAIAGAPRSRTALERAGRLAFMGGDYAGAQTLLRRALTAKPEPDEAADDKVITAMVETAERLPQLSLSRELPARMRAEHLGLAAGSSEGWLNRCMAMAQTAPVGTVKAGKTEGPAQQSDEAALEAEPLQQLKARWKTADSKGFRRAMRNDASIQDGMTQLIYDTEIATAAVCGVPTGDDGLLLGMAQASAKAHGRAPGEMAQ